MTKQQPKIAVIGAGITGLAAAYYFQKKLTEANITIIEQQDRPGGKVQTIRQDGFVIERGPDSFLARKPKLIELVKELGLEHELVGLNPNVGAATILHKGEFHPIPSGFVMGIPTKLKSLLKTQLISFPGKVRASLDLILPRGSISEDESLGEFLERRLGKEVVTQIAEPLLSGIYAGDIYGLSAKATFPQFLTLQHKYRSLILGMIQSQNVTGKPKPDLPQFLQNSTFLHLRNGLSTIIESLTEHLKQQQFLYRTEVVSIFPKEDGQFQLQLDNGREMTADAVIMAIPPFKAAQMLPKTPTINKLDQIKHVSVANVILGYERKPKARYKGTGFLIPRKEGRFITACTFTSDKWPHTAPEQAGLIRCYVGREGQTDWMNLHDEEMVKHVRNELEELIGLKDSPDFYKVTRWKQSMPQYSPGHHQIVASIRSHIKDKWPGIYLTGAGFGGVGLPDCVAQGKETAELVAEYLKKPKN